MNVQALDLFTSNETVYVSFKFGDARYAEMLDEFYQLRKRIFVDQLEWELSHPNGRERDQYDREDAEYVLALRDGVCVGGLRMASTTTSFNVEGKPYSYMLRDAVKGRLGSFPTNATSYAPTDSTVWELTRVISGKSPVELRNLLWQARMRLITKGVKECVFITRPVVTKVSKAWGYNMSVTGPVLDFGTMKAGAVRCNIKDVRQSCF